MLKKAQQLKSLGWVFLAQFVGHCRRCPDPCSMYPPETLRTFVVHLVSFFGVFSLIREAIVT